jgi:diguanylate cyclase (GGDEF)-like protein
MKYLPIIILNKISTNEAPMKLINKFIILAIVISMGITYYNQFNSIVHDYRTEIEFKGLWIGKHIDLSSGLLELMKVYGNNYINNREASSEYFGMLKYDEEKQGYHLDAIEGTEAAKRMGNLTGLGQIPKDELLRREINLGLEINSFFRKIQELIPDASWLYYTSDSGFSSIYPFVSSDEFFYKDEFREASFFSYANPINNPERKSVWTPVYLDLAGKGLMVTYSCPLYVEEEFKGIISLDFTNQFFSNILYSEYEGYVADQTGALVAASKNIEFGDEIIYINDIMDFTRDEWEMIEDIGDNGMKIISGEYIYRSGFASSPWTMYFRLPIVEVANRAFLLTLPMIVICSLFLYALFEIERRKKIQSILSATIKECKEYQDLLENAAKYDFLTSTLNRRGMEEELSMIANSEEEKMLYILMADLDKFKKLNDTYGHEAGDKVLIEVAEIFKRMTERKGYVSRWGGEEFLLVITEVDQKEIFEYAENIRESVEKAHIPWKDDQLLKVTVTMGIAEYSAGESLYKCISNADEALYQGKRNGRNRVIRYNEKSVNADE